MDELQKDDRVVRDGKGPNDPKRYGTVTRVYRSQPSGVGQAVQLCDVLWDDTGREEVGYIPTAGGLRKYTVVA